MRSRYNCPGEQFADVVKFLTTTPNVVLRNQLIIARHGTTPRIMLVAKPQPAGLGTGGVEVAIPLSTTLPATPPGLRMQWFTIPPPMERVNYPASDFSQTQVKMLAGAESCSLVLGQSAT